MAGNKRQKPPAVSVQQPPPPSSPTPKATSKYTNKDGSKFITVPKGNPSPVTSPSSPALPPPASVESKGTTQFDPAEPGSSGATTVNRKKQKRREKAAAKAAAERALHPEPQGGTASPGGSVAPSLDRRSLDVNYENSEGEDEHYDNGHDPHDHAPQTNGASAKSKKSKKKKKKSGGTAAEGPYEHHDQDEDDDYDNDPDLEYDDAGHSHRQDHHAHHQHSHISHHSTVHTHHRAVDQPKKKLWNDSTTEERQGIRQYWYDLSEEERKKLVRIEKEAVLRKMKEQQKQTCSCTVCGRKRNAIEEELEGLYDAYYQELAQYAKRSDQQPNEQAEALPPAVSQKQHHPPVGGVHATRGQPSNHALQPSHARIVEHLGDEEDDSVEGDDYSEDDYDEEEDEYSDEEPVDEDSLDRGDLEAFSSFSNSLTVEGGILTVADDLLKNDGRKFIEMMEQLAEKRMQRQEDAYRARGDYGHPNDNAGYNHNDAPPLEDDEVEYEDEDDDYEGEEDDQDYDSEEEEAMTEKERMEEGRRMFQIFAARMFEQRVLQAYRQKVAKERQEQLIHEEEEAKRKELERQEKKRRDAQKRKEKAALKKAELAEAKRLKEEVKAKQAEERRMEEERKAEEQRQKAEEKRKKKEAQKKAEEEERKRKEAERLRRAHEQKEKQAEQERKAREAKEKEKKAREEAARMKEQEAKERKEREARERKEQQEREQREQQEEAKARQAEQEAREKKVKQQQQQRKQEEAAAQKPATAVPITLARRPAQHPAATAVPALPQQPASTAAAVASPLIPVATPIMPLAPTPMRNRQPSQQESSLGSSASHSASSTSQVPSPHSMTPVHASPGPFGPQTKPGSVGGQGGQGIYHQGSQQASPMNINSMHGPFSGFGGPPMSSAMGGFGHGPPPGFQQHPGFGGHTHPNQVFPGAPFGSSFPNQGMMPMQGGINRPLPGRGLSLPQPPPGILPPLDTQSGSLGGQGFPPIGLHRDSTASLHQRHPSAGGFDAAPGTPVLSSSQPRPAPIRRPGSVVQSQRAPPGLPLNGRDSNETEDLQFGSSALLDDSEEVAQDFPPPSARRNTSVPGQTMPFAGLYGDAAFSSGPGFGPWGQATGGQPFGSSPPPPAMSSFAASQPWAHSLPNTSAFGAQTLPNRLIQRPTVRMRQLLCDACTRLAAAADMPVEDRLEGGFVSLEAVKEYVGREPFMSTPTDKDVLEIFETLGDATNGGGNFETTTQHGKRYVRWVRDGSGADTQLPMRRVGGLGEIGSPVVTAGAPMYSSLIGRQTS